MRLKGGSLKGEGNAPATEDSSAALRNDKKTGNSKCNRRSFDFALRASLRMTLLRGRCAKRTNNSTADSCPFDSAQGAE